MFKKLLTVGALATALIGGIGTAIAEYSCQSTDTRYKGTDSRGTLYERYVVNPNNNFANTFTSDGIKWYLKRVDGACKFRTGNTAYQAYYEGRTY
ncbi:LCI family antimicrobial peptide [Xenorhabdus sp. PR6a]|uniref:LCI fold-containing protein n=1 Tax=Xenorhabdus sp. PR6a TaxID=3025877 RepID=UPI002359EAB8|nr:LCI fold-containing protein [Xenorhabdus sp. PR6a]MDC9581681.1 LCI family antimicrobial peptide [Xenorhabdus sp. PR6a]